MKTLILAAIRCSLMFTAVAALSLAYPASVQAVPTTYQVHRQPLHRRDRPLHHERLRDGNGDVGGPPGTEHAAHRSHAHRFYIVRWGADNNVTTTPTLSPYSNSQRTHTAKSQHWVVDVESTRSRPSTYSLNDVHRQRSTPMRPIPGPRRSFGDNFDTPGVWTPCTPVPDAGSTLSLMTLTLMALGLVARRFQRAAA